MRKPSLTAFARRRRVIVRGAPALLLGAAAPGLLLSGTAALGATPPMTEGPFYPDPPPAERDADLTTYDGGRSPGEVIEIAGRVLDAKSSAIEGAVVQIWHCDPGGVYAHVGARTHPHFQGFGVVRTGADGAFRFRTVRPGLYTGRARHVHFRIRSDRSALSTQMFFPGDPSNQGDFLLRRLRDPAALTARLEADAPPRYGFDVILSG